MPLSSVSSPLPGLAHALAWSLSPGDPTLLGWGTTVSYLASTALLLLAFRRRRGAQTPGAPAWVYLTLAALMLLLGLNKQLDLQELIEVVGRRVALAQGWYEQRRFVQRVFVASLAVVTATCGAWLVFTLRRALRDLWLMALGVALVGTYALVRAAYFHHVDVLGAARLGASPASWVIELLGVACIATAAARVAWGEVEDRAAPDVPQA